MVTATHDDTHLLARSVTVEDARDRMDIGRNACLKINERVKLEKKNV
jgi:hypothetical protein